MPTVRAVPAAVTLPLRQQVLRPHQTVEELREPDDDTPDSASFAAVDDATGAIVGTGVVRRRPPPWAGGAGGDGAGGDHGDSRNDHERWQVRAMAVAPGHRGRGDGDDDSTGRSDDADREHGHGRDDREGRDDGDGWQVRAMAVAPGQRGRGVGRAVLDALLAHVDAAGGGTVWCNARVPARGFYERAGFAAVGEPFELPDIGPHVVMAIRRPARR